jgi:hypothetical protein
MVEGQRLSLAQATCRGPAGNGGSGAPVRVVTVTLGILCSHTSFFTSDNSKSCVSSLSFPASRNDASWKATSFSWKILTLSSTSHAHCQSLTSSIRHNCFNWVLRHSTDRVFPSWNESLSALRVDVISEIGVYCKSAGRSMFEPVRDNS